MANQPDFEFDNQDQQSNSAQFGRNKTPKARRRGAQPLRRSGGSKTKHSGIQNRRRKRVF